MSHSVISLGLGLGGGKSATSSGRSGGGGAYSNSVSILLDGTDERMVLDSEISLSGAFTVSFWIKPLSGNEGWLMTGLGGTAAGGFYLSWYGPAYDNQLIVRDTGLTINTGIDTLVAGSWYHVAVIRDSSNNVKAYINGVQRGPTDSSGATTAAEFKYLGSVKTSSSNSLHGNMDEVALWDSDQTSNLAAIYNSGVPDDLSGLSPTHWWRMGDINGSSGTTIADQGSGSVNCETINSPAYSSDVPS